MSAQKEIFALGRFLTLLSSIHAVRISQLRESAEVASGQDKLAGYELYDLVMLSGGGSANEVGVITRVGREDFSVINNHGIVREVRPAELRGKRNSQSNRASAGDVQANLVRVGDLVNVLEGPHKGKTATIKRINRTQLFLYSQTRTENAGIFVVRSRSCVQAGLQAQKRGNVMDGGVSPFSTPRSQTGGGPVGGRGGKLSFFRLRELSTPFMCILDTHSITLIF